MKNMWVSIFLFTGHKACTANFANSSKVASICSQEQNSVAFGASWRECKRNIFCFMSLSLSPTCLITMFESTLESLRLNTFIALGRSRLNRLTTTCLECLENQMFRFLSWVLHTLCKWSWVREIVNTLQYWAHLVQKISWNIQHTSS